MGSCRQVAWQASRQDGGASHEGGGPGKRRTREGPPAGGAEARLAERTRRYDGHGNNEGQDGPTTAREAATSAAAPGGSPPFGGS